MPGRVLLDTNVIIGFLAGDDQIVRRLADVEEVFAPAVALGELYYGAHKSARSEANLQRVQEFVATVVVLGVDADTAAVYGRIKDSLRSKGRPIPDNDLWMAAISLQHGLTLATRDAHFAEIDDLVTENC